MRRRVAALALLLAGCSCDGASGGPDPGELTDAVAHPGDALPRDGEVDQASPDIGDPRGQIVPDAGPPDATPDVAPPPGECGSREPVRPAAGLDDLVATAEILAGSPPTASAALAADLDGDGAIDRLVVRGGRVEAYDPAGQLRWRTGVLGASTVAAVTDLDRNGRREVVAHGVRDLFVLDALTGEVRYLADTGCSGRGQGQGAVLTFRDGIDQGRVLALIDPDGRCAKWHGFGDLDGDRLPELLVSDGQGLTAYSPRDGRRLYCGDLSGVAAPGVAPHLALGSELLVFLGDRVVWATLGEATDRCPEAPALVERRADQVPGVIDPAGAAARDLDGDGRLDALFSYFDGERWQTVGLSGATGARLLERADAPLLGVTDLDADGHPELLVRAGDPREPPPLGTVELVEDDQRLWSRARATTVDLRPGAHETERSLEITQPLVVGGAAALLSASGATVDLLSLVGADGAERRLPLEGPPGAVLPAGDGLLLADSVARLRLLDAALTPLGEPALAPAGGVRTAVVEVEGAKRLLTLSSSGHLANLDPANPEAPPTWTRYVGSGALLTGIPRAGSDLALVEDGVAGPATWAALDTADGAEVWAYSVDLQADVLRDGPRVVGELVLRVDRPVDGGAPAEEPGCPPAETNGEDHLTPEEECPERPIIVWAITARDAATGACRWRTHHRSLTSCFGAPNQALSGADGDGDGRPEIYATLSRAVLRLDPADGTIAALLDNGVFGVAPRGGGWIRETGGQPPLVRTGGYGPIDGLLDDLTVAWRAELPDQRGQQWILRDATGVAAAQVWTSPGTGQALHRYDLSDGTLLGTSGLHDGVVERDAEGLFDEIRSLEELSDRGQTRILAVASDRLYALRPDGTLDWSRRFDAVLDSAQVLPDGPRLLVTLSDGRALVLEAAVLPAPVEAWDVPCPAELRCNPEADIDETTGTAALCAEFHPLPEADRVGGYEARVLGANDAPLTAWTAVDAPAAELPLALVPDVLYRVEVRAWRQQGERRLTSAGRVTDGVRLRNATPPAVDLTLSAEQLELGGPPLVVLVEGRDDDRLAGWRMEVLDAGDATVRTLAAAAIALPEFAARREWDGLGDDGAPAAPGRYAVRATFVDRARNEGTAEASVEVCDGPCE